MQTQHKNYEYCLKVMIKEIFNYQQTKKVHHILKKKQQQQQQQKKLLLTELIIF